jgi:hypothetical protein
LDDRLERLAERPDMVDRPIVPLERAHDLAGEQDIVFNKQDSGSVGHAPPLGHRPDTNLTGNHAPGQIAVSGAR